MSCSTSEYKLKRTWLITVVVLSCIAVGLPKHHDNLGGPYKHACVAADAGPCSQIGKGILQVNGSAVDAAIAAMFCIGVINMHSAGIGGGGFMLVYSRRKKSAEVFDLRETAAYKATEDMFKNASYNNTLATCVPGEVRGFHAAWKAYGRLPWKQLVQPAIDKAKYGFIINTALYQTMVKEEDNIRKDPGLSELFIDDVGKLKKKGDNITNPQYAETLEHIRDRPESFYRGSLAERIVRDVRKGGGIFTLRDLKHYRVKRRRALVNRMGNMTWYTTPPPAGGAVLTLILNILKGYNMTLESIANTSQSSLTYHRIIEAFKFGYAWRTKLGDPHFNKNMSKIVSKMTNQAFADSLRQKIWDNQTHSNASYYGYSPQSAIDHGTSHLSVLSPNGDAVALTSSVAHYFGCKYRSTDTGIIYNNVTVDFPIPGLLRQSKSNRIEPTKRPQSSMSPVIFTDEDGRVRLVVGASGGPRITTAVALTLINELWLSRGISEAIDAPRIHHTLFPNTVKTEYWPYNISQGIQDGLRARNHHVEARCGDAAVQAVARNEKKDIYGKCDPRKQSGWPAGF